MNWKTIIRAVETDLALTYHTIRAKATQATLTIKRNPRISLNTSIHLGENAKLSIGENFQIGRHCKIVVYPNAKLTIGDNVTLTDNVYIQCMSEMKIGSDLGFAPYVFIVDYNHDYTKLNLEFRRMNYNVKRVCIKNNSWLGAHAVVLPGVTIGEHAVVGANSTVTKSIPDYAVAVGNPAKVIKYIKKKGELGT